ncbi:hypothetical protein LGK97_08085 [Clostridium sp. CS001]|uniref:hypothetical protein n=1 Tax=Clostridium sp. CS001 TaxID=2880648 RepID=UPI001CF4B3BC|nr:hypothetical protein [Clostridium sp. CS001]MCB2289722.1 hypothetical protein [Clostridium sp. CS001]
MNDKLNDKPVTFEHPEKLTKGVTLKEGNITAKAFISEEDGCVKSNIVIENKITGNVSKKDAVIGNIDEDVDEEEIEEY